MDPDIPFGSIPKIKRYPVEPKISSVGLPDLNGRKMMTMIDTSGKGNKSNFVKSELSKPMAEQAHGFTSQEEEKKAAFSTKMGVLQSSGQSSESFEAKLSKQSFSSLQKIKILFPKSSAAARLNIEEEEKKKEEPQGL